ncbi:Thyroid transcription factor 1-associated protein 26 like protein [Eufriesea mexicana]|uniref:Thyroid transcription factor 1-associated protein 26 like protein n=1 Tax=Eufriesea mexicana TaxID=516756 RepID=A0A310SE93_9HYME|nr:PREDICTED: rRNA-processing protein fyv7 [Eufriesea mexicana]OAD56005.1 Thyroid transcription factor 1-associated protein 26 like protein [Eufriesea mexicana]
MKSSIQGISNRKQMKEGNEKKPFNKKKYRLQKYSNKYKIKQWEERKKKAILRSFYKQIDKDQQRNLKKPSVFKDDNQNEHTTQPPKKSAFYKAKQEYLRKKDEKCKQKEETLRVKAEREEALKKYKEKKMQTYKKLSKKTKTGQPVMKDRLEMLLEKIQQQVSM